MCAGARDQRFLSTSSPTTLLKQTFTRAYESRGWDTCIYVYMDAKIRAE